MDWTSSAADAEDDAVVVAAAAAAGVAVSDAAVFAVVVTVVFVVVAAGEDNITVDSRVRSVGRESDNANKADEDESIDEAVSSNGKWLSCTHMAMSRLILSNSS